ncbi:acyl-CoA N-acyltransferase [Amylocystis lapponica]|nr:acyl-CoA N-acyltransferase [Amylocystis lapponica]
MPFINNYVPPPQSPVLPDTELYGTDPYDINFAYPLPAEALENERVRLTPFVPAPFRYFPFFHATLPEFLTFVELRCRRAPHALLFAVIDKTRPDPAHPELDGALAGVLAMFNTAPQNLSTEVGFVVVFPAFRHTHVARNMVGLLLRYLLELPSASPPGLGFRRVSWSAHPGNAASQGLARTMGCKKDGHLRWMWVLPDALASEGRKSREGDPFVNRMARDSVVLAICWDDWESGGRENVMTKMAK